MSLKDEGNAEFRKGNWLKAAGLYTKAIKANPDDIAVLYSNRSAALLKLSKANKALEDADECIRLRPEWDKGHFRKAQVLELTGKYSEALDAMREAMHRSPGNEEMGRKVRQLQKMADGAAPAARTRREKENQCDNGAAVKSPAISRRKGKEPPAASEPEQELERPLQEAPCAGPRHAEELPAHLAEFQRDCLSHALARSGEPSVYFLHGQGASRPEAGEEGNMSQIKISQAFNSPDLLHNCLSFLREYAAEKAALAACAVVPLSAVAYPQVWKRRGWPFKGESAQGTLIQLEAPKLCRVWYVLAEAQDASEAMQLSSDYKLLEPLFR